jgi:hypothetical protein
MTPKKPLHEREKELQSLLTTPAGREKLEELAAKYHAVSGKVKPAGASAITYILVHERQHGLIGN